MSTSSDSTEYDVIVVGSGFGGSVAALRLTEKGYRVCVVEGGRRFADDEFAKNSWDARRFLFAPRLGCFGIQRIRLLRDVVVLAGAGVGGGSLVYANTLYEPKSDSFYLDDQWKGISDWREELAPYYDQAKRMLGVRPNPTMTESDRIMREVADELGVGDTFGMAPVGVFFGRDDKLEPGVEVADPYFGGVGPARNGCLQCGECMTGCRHNAKNTLLKNYLYLAEQAGAEIRERTTVDAVVPDADGGYTVEVHRTGRSRRRTATTLSAPHVVLAAGTWGTQELLHAMKRRGVLPGISDRLGHLTRTNSEALCTSSTRLTSKDDRDFTQGVAITSSIHPDPTTHIEPCRYGDGSGFMGLLTTVMTDGGGRTPRVLKWLGQILRHPAQFAGHYAGIRSWSRRTIIALVMQTHDNSITVFPKRRLLGRGVRLSSRQGHGEPNPTWIPVANEAVRKISEKIDGAPFSTIGEVFNVPMTAHFLGGCVIGDSAETGVIDAYHRVYGHEGLHVTDGSAISANIGVNPSLTITAQAERAMALWPNKGERDLRPGLGATYRKVPVTTPRAPAVPPQAPAALRLPLIAANGRPIGACSTGQQTGLAS